MRPRYSYIIRVRGCVSRISEATLIVYSCLSRSNAPPIRRSRLGTNALFLDPILDATAQAGGRRLGLDQVIEGAELQSTVDQFFLAVVREDDDGNVFGHPVGSEILEHGESVHLGKPDVEEDDVGYLALGAVEALLAGLRHADPVAIQLQLELVHLGHRRVIFDEQDVYIPVHYLTHVPSLFNRPLFHAGAGSLNRPLFHAGAGSLGPGWQK